MPASTGSTTELHIQSGMHIDSPDGVIARSPVNEDTQIAADNAANAPEQHDPRQSIMDAIVANRAKTFEKELEYAASHQDDDALALAADDAVATAVPAQKPAKPVGEQSATETTVTPENLTVGDEPAPKKTIVVNGHSLEFSDDELVKLAQRGLSADQRYQEAAAMQRQYQHALAMAQGMQQQHQQTTQQASAGQTAPQGQQSLVDDAVAGELARRITFGTEEDQKKAVSDIINVAARAAGRTQQVLPADQLVNVATQNALSTLRFEQNMETIGREFPDIFKDEDMTILAARQVNKLRYKYEALGTPKSDIDIYREAGGMVRDRYLKGEGPAPTQTSPSTPSPVQSAQPAASLSAKVERKRAAPQPPAAASKIASEAAPASTLTGSQIVAQMRKSRHQPAY